MKINNKLFFTRIEFSVKCIYSTKVTFAALANMKQVFFLLVNAAGTRAKSTLQQRNITSCFCPETSWVEWRFGSQYGRYNHFLRPFSYYLACTGTRYYIHASHCTLLEFFVPLPPDNTNVVF